MTKKQGYARRHKQSIRAYMTNYITRRLKTDPIFAMTFRIRDRVRKAVLRAGKFKKETTLALLGCTPTQFKRHLEALFLPGMSWANRQLWHIDHIKPIASFDLTTLEGQKAAFHYTNCQPLWAADNLSKGART